MQISSSFLGLGLLVRGAFAVGSVTIVNQCSFDVNLWSVSNVQGPQVTLSSGTGAYTETYGSNSNGGGVSIKITNEEYITDPITQLEYTLGTGQWDSLVWYDVSNINGEPFSTYGVTLVPSDSTCATVTCTASDPTCSANVYLQPDDNYAVHACSVDASLVFTLCTDDTTSVVPSSTPTTTAVASSTTTPNPTSIDVIPTVSSYYLISETFWSLSTVPASFPALAPLSTTTVTVIVSATPVCAPTSTSSPEITITRTTLITHYTTADSIVTVTDAAKPRLKRAKAFFA